MKWNTGLFIEYSNIIHDNEYSYENAVYKNCDHNITITCKVHGDFNQIAKIHLKGSGCPRCYFESMTKSRATNVDEFIDKANKVHNKKYDYSKVSYKNNSTKVSIICKEHGEFLQTPGHHINQQNGCPHCRLSKGELRIKSYLESKSIRFKSPHRFIDCKNKKPLPFDFYLPELNICIEYDGLQHYRPFKYFGGEKKFNTTKINDSIKTNYCKESNIKLIRIPYTELNKVEKTLDSLI